MPKANQVNWQPISQMPLIGSMIDTSLIGSTSISAP
jgi:hypothetical protein